MMCLGWAFWLMLSTSLQGGGRGEEPACKPVSETISFFNSVWLAQQQTDIRAALFCQRHTQIRSQTAQLSLDMCRFTTLYLWLTQDPKNPNMRQSELYFGVNNMRNRAFTHSDFGGSGPSCQAKVVVPVAIIK